MSVKSKLFSICFAFLMIALIIAHPDISSSGVSRGILISANVVIPSLFPFMVCVLMILKSGFVINNRFINNFLMKIFGHSFNMFFVFVLSMIGGYPVGARLLNKLYEQKAIDNKTADIMLMYCVNAGPAFIVSIVGGVFNSPKIGIALLVSHLLSSVIIALFYAKKIKKQNHMKQNTNEIKTFSENFVESVSEASGSILSICCFVIFFSFVNLYLDYFFADMPIIKYISLFTEVTSAVASCKNIYVTSFLLGFAGLSIWCQVFALSGKRKINMARFVVGRLLHGTISVFLTKIFITVFKISIKTFNNNIKFNNYIINSDILLFFSMFIMLTVLFTFLYTKNNSGKIINDVI